MSRKTAIHNGKLTSDLDANGFRILNAQGGGGGGGSGGGAVDSVNGKTGAVVLDASDIRRDAGEDGTIQDALGDIEIALGEKVDTDESRLTNARTPTSHASSHATGGSDAVTPASIGAQPTLAADGSDLPGGPYLPTSGGDIDGDLKIVGEIEVVAGSVTSESFTINGEQAATESQLPYASTNSPADRTCSTVTVASTGASITIPKPSTANKVTAFCVYLDMTALTGTAPTVGFKYSDNTDADILTRGGEGLSYETGAVNAVFFIQCGTKYIASAQVYKEASNG